MSIPTLHELSGGISYTRMSPAQREEWASRVREYKFRVCETCGGRTGEFCYVNDLMPNSEVRRGRPMAVQRDGWCNGWTDKTVRTW